MNYEALCNEVIIVAKKAGTFILNEAKNFSASKIEYKGLNDMVSYVDKTAEQMIVDQLSQLLPESGFIAEEGTSNKTGETYNWIIDPLDGTTNFIHGIPAFAVSIALKKDNELVVGVVYEINQDECFYAWKDSKAYLNGNEIHVSDNEALSTSLVATGFPYYDFKRQANYMNLFSDVMQKCHGLRRIGAASVDMVYTACGRFDAYFEYNLKAWDVAAGILIVKQAGGECFDFVGGDDMLGSGDIVATNGKVSAELNQIIHHHFNS
ncbi:inositol monophosphatase family protein [Pedobacter arcticus]|uniref:inositol monophosphatase family protein n=1 Tax=Pedobacter arcticus TaxID=752140 RepID=UPI0002DC54A2|nr:inositol monophosphatase family protein [Pedobacter arcticus]